jgi:UDP-N-acetylglucosamine--N-acetylmuramyl-(pentapeptide) pyrophosphoryl-undecaprenol N-acetylglucosamine transferase
MTTYLLAGGGTAGHVNPLLATADELQRTENTATIIVLGTAEGLESRLVPESGFELVTIAKLPFPRALSIAAVTYPARLAKAVKSVRTIIRERKVDVVVGFGGYASAPAYLAARAERIPVVVHEANAIPGIANKLGAAFTRFVGVTFAGTPIAHATTVGMPLRREIASLDRESLRDEARRFFGIRGTNPVLLVTGGSTGAARINATVAATAAEVIASGWDIIHTVGESREFRDPAIPGYHALPYCNRMDLALAVAELVIARAGAATVSELSGLGIPTVFVPYPVGNGEQARNASDIVAAGGALLCLDADFTPDFVRTTVLGLMSDAPARRAMTQASTSVGIRDGAARLAALIRSAIAQATP